MIRFVVFLFLSVTSLWTLAQTKATQDLHEKYQEGSFTLFFYKSTLRMLDDGKSKEFYELVKDIDKAKLLRIDKIKQEFRQEDYMNYLAQIAKEGYEEIMTIRESGENINIFLKEADKKTEGIILLMNSEENLALLDIIGMIDLKHVAALVSKVNLTEEHDPSSRNK